MATLDRLISLRGAPRYLRFDNGPEFIACVIRDWAAGHSMDLAFIDPGSAWQHAWIVINGWRPDYNTNRPHSVLSNPAPAAYATQWHTRHQTPVDSHS